MKFPLSWIKEYVDVKVSVEKLAEDLQFTGTKVERVEKRGGETILDFEITPNRADCYNVFGIAREIAAIYELPLKNPKVFSQTRVLNKERLSLKVSDKNLCPRYTYGIIDSVQIGPSPNWIKQRLEDSEVKSLNSVVDITNYVMLETGQPMHAFDKDKISGSINLRGSKKGESIITLDGIKRQIPETSIIIEDAEKIIDLAGLMGGKSSEIDKNTKKILLHVPIYDPVTIRKTSQALGLRTEASGRFEKKLDPAGHRFAFERALKLIRTSCGGELISSIDSTGYPVMPGKINLELSLINRTLGINLKKSEVTALLNRLGFLVGGNSSNQTLAVEIPSFRTDIVNPIDLSEEIGRLYGYNRLPKTLSVEASDSPPKNDFDFELKIKRILSGLGLNEAIGSSLTSYTLLERLGIDSSKCLKVSNRILADYEHLRPNIFVSLMEAVRTNTKNSREIGMFEIGRVFISEKFIDDLPFQPKKVGVLVNNSNASFCKGLLEALIGKLNIGPIRYEKTDSELFDEFSVDVFTKNEQIGYLGSISAKKTAKVGIDTALTGFELEIDYLKKLEKQTIFIPLPKYPLVKEDISLFLPDKTRFEEIKIEIEKSAGEYFHELRVLEDTRINNKRSLLLEVEYYDKNGTLNREKIKKIRTKVLEALDKIGAEIRSD